MRTLSLIFLSLLAFTGIADAALVADYPLQGDLQSTVVGAPPLATVGTGTAFATETVRGSDRLVLTYDGPSGVALFPVTSVLANLGVYSVVMLVRHAGVPVYDKQLDFKNGMSDFGVYDSSGALEFFPVTYGEEVVGTEYTNIALTRDADGLVSGYVGGQLQFAFDDADELGVIDSANTLRFFLDDDTTSGVEAYPAAVARIRVWDNVLDAHEIAALEPDRIFAYGFDASH